MTDDYSSAEMLLQSLSAHGVECLFANFGTDHTPILEAIAQLRADDKESKIPKIVMCPHEFAALSAAHGYAAVTNKSQAVLVHVDVGTQNLGAAMHNAHRAKIPVFVIAGLAPVTDTGYPGSRDNPVHYLQDVFDQQQIVEEYCRWTTEYRPPADIDALVVRGLERANTPPKGPVYLSATREALETSTESSASRSVRDLRPAGADMAIVRDVAELVISADRPLVITTELGRTEDGFHSLVSFAETAGVGVIEQRPTALSFPRNHELHLGFDPSDYIDDADLILLVATDVPWMPSAGVLSDDTHVVQLDTDVSKATFPYWDFPVDRSVCADPVRTLNAVTEHIDSSDHTPSTPWSELARDRRKANAEVLDAHHNAGRLTPEVLSNALNFIVDESTIVLDDAVTSRNAVLDHLHLSEPGNYYASGGAGLGWAVPAGIGAKLANPEARIISVTGDGAYVFANPTACAWLNVAAEAPTITVIYDNQGWNAVKQATLRQHPDGVAAKDGVPGSVFEPSLDLSAPAKTVDAFTRTVESTDALDGALEQSIEAVTDGIPVVLDVKLEPI